MKKGLLIGLCVFIAGLLALGLTNRYQLKEFGPRNNTLVRMDKLTGKSWLLIRTDGEYKWEELGKTSMIPATPKAEEISAGVEDAKRKLLDSAINGTDYGFDADAVTKVREHAREKLNKPQ